MKEVKWQVERNVTWYRHGFNTSAPMTELNLDQVFLLGEVLSKIKSLAVDMVKVHNAGNVKVDYVDYKDVRNLPPIRGNIPALITVFRNLVENAVKYTSDDVPSSIIRIGSKVLDDFVVVYIEDNGIGVPKGEAKWIFVDGYRCDNAIRRKPGGGSGIGLPQSLDLMTAMGGNLTYEKVGEWTRFVVTLQKYSEDDL